VKCPTTSDRPYVTAVGDNCSVKIPATPRSSAGRHKARVRPQNLAAGRSSATTGERLSDRLSSWTTARPALSSRLIDKTIRRPAGRRSLLATVIEYEIRSARDARLSAKPLGSQRRFGRLTNDNLWRYAGHVVVSDHVTERRARDIRGRAWLTCHL